MAILELNNVHYSEKGLQIIKGITHSIEPGTVTAFLGKPGSGKSTALKLLAGLIPPTRGKVLFNSKDIHNMTRTETLEFRKYAAFMFQDSALWANQDIYHNLDLPLQIHYPTMTAEQRKLKIQEMVNLVEYEKPLTNRPAALSIGEQKKISFARALICEPQLLFLDEPTESLDEKTVNLFISILTKFTEEKKTLIYVSHDNHLINSFMSDKIYYANGEIQEKVLLDDGMKNYYEDEL